MVDFAGGLGALFGGLTQGAEAGISLGQKQQEIDLRQSQQGVGLLNAMVNMRRMPLEMRKIVMPGILKQYEKAFGQELPKTMYDLATKADDNMWPKAVDALVGTLPEKFDRASIAAWAKQADDPEMQLKMADQIRKLVQGEEGVAVRREGLGLRSRGYTTTITIDEFGNSKRVVTPTQAPSSTAPSPAAPSMPGAPPAAPNTPPVAPPNSGVAQTDDQKATEVLGLLGTATTPAATPGRARPGEGLRRPPGTVFAPPSPALEGPQLTQAPPTGPTPPVDMGDRTKQGAEYLASLPRASKDVVEGLITYKTDPKSLSASRRAQWIAMARRADPNYDDKIYGTQKAQQTRTEVEYSAAGQTGRTLIATRTAYNHLASLAQAYDALKNGDIPAANRLVNMVRRQTGEPMVAPVDTAALAVGTEIAKALRGAGALSLEEEKRWSNALNAAANSPAQMKATIGELDKLIQGRFSEMQSQYQSVFKGKELPGMDSPEYMRSKEFLSKWTKPAEKKGPPGTAPPTRQYFQKGNVRIYSDDGKSYFYEDGRPYK